MQVLFGTLGLELGGVGHLDVAEPPEGSDVQENAVAKAQTYCAAGGHPCIANDYGLRLTGLRDDDQPGAFVRRLAGSKPASDDRLLQVYAEKIRALGGEVDGTWTAALAIAFDPSDVVSTVATHTRRFVDMPSPVVLPGEPLASLQIDPTSGRYVSELEFSERARSPSPVDSIYVRFVESHLHRLRAAASVGR
jgi:hypothetical protein